MNTHRSTSGSIRLGVHQLELRAVPATLLVDDDLVQFPNAEYTTIQEAVDAAAPGDTVLVARGTYTEQVTVPAEKDGLTLRSQNPLMAIIQAPDAITGEPAVVTVDGAEDVTLRGFTITGPAVEANSLTYGVAITAGGSATVWGNFITRIRNNPLDGVQTGIGVFVDGADATTSAVIRDNTITDYQKGGIVVFGSNGSATVTRNTIVGVGPTDVIAQNGIQVSDGADAVVTRNTISGNVYLGEDAVGTGILVDTAGQVQVTDNKLTSNQVGLLVQTTDLITVVGNRVTNNSLDGIDLLDVNGGLVADNRVENNGVDGVVLSDANGVLVIGNTIRRNGQDGLVLTDGSALNLVFGNSLRQNERYDAFDDTTGSLTGGTRNLWFFNRIGTKNNDGLR